MEIAPKKRRKGGTAALFLLLLHFSALPLSAITASSLPQSCRDPISASELKLEQPFRAEIIRTLTQRDISIGRVGTGPAGGKAEQSPKWCLEEVLVDSSTF